MPLSVSVAKHINVFLTSMVISFSPSCSAALHGSPLVWVLKLHSSVVLPLLGVGVIFPSVTVRPLWLLGNISHWFSTSSSLSTWWALQRGCSLPLTSVWQNYPTVDEAVARPLLLPAFLPWPALPFFPVDYLNSFWGGIPKRMRVLFVWLCVSLSTFSSPFESLSTQEITLRDLTFPFSFYSKCKPSSKR